MIITINGSPGSGKSTVAEKLAEKLKYKRIYGGGIRRKMAQKKGMTLAEFNKWGETHFESDKIVDDYMLKIAKKEKNLIIESRIHYFLIPTSLKIFLYADTETGAKRIWKNYKNTKTQRNEDVINSLEDLIESIEKRQKSDLKRYKKFYKADIWNKKNYDLWLDVSKMDKRQEFDTVYKFIKNKLKKGPK